MLHRPILRHPIFRCPRNRFAHPASVLILALSSTLVCTAQVSVTTHHYDNYRTGWNSQETALTPATVHSSSFGVLKTIVLDDQVEAQPLVVPGVNITAGKFKGTTHDVVYVATDNNSIYAIDVTSGAVLLKPNFGPPVVKPLGCHIYNPDVGINSTPVIDLSSNTLYAVIYTQQSTAPAYFVHALDLGSLTDKVTPQLVTGSHTLTDGTTDSFNATYHRQRPALLLVNGNVYAAFGSFCDKAPNLSRGWLLGWQTGTLAPLGGNQLTDTQATSPEDYFLSAIWMSGYGPAADDSGNILFVQQLRSFRNHLRWCNQHSGERGEGVVRSDHGTGSIHSQQRRVSGSKRSGFRRGRSDGSSRPARFHSASGGGRRQNGIHVLHERRRPGWILHGNEQRPRHLHDRSLLVWTVLFRRSQG